MSTPYIGEIRLFAGNFAPLGWRFCDGSLIAISENDTLYNLIGTTYGGDGQSTFALPDLRGRLPLHMGSGLGQNFTQGEQGGVESVTLTVNQIPSHTHLMMGSNDSASSRTPSSSVLGRSAADAYASEFDPVALSPQSVASMGGNQPHENFQPYLCINFIISEFGIYPSQS